MPQIRQYVNQSRIGTVEIRGRATPGVDLKPVVAAGFAVSDAYDQLKEAQRRESERLALDEARMSTTNTLSEGSALWTEKIADAKTKAPADAAGFTAGTLKEFDAWANEKTGSVTDPAARRMLDEGIRKMRLGLHADAFQFETTQRTKALGEAFSVGLDSDRRTVTADPTQFQTLLAKRLATAETLTIAPDMRAKLIDASRRTLASDAANGLIDTNPAAYLERAGVRSAKGAKGATGSRAEYAASRVASDPILSNLAPEDLRRTIDRASMIVAQQDAAHAAEAERQARLAELAAARREREAGQAWTILSNRAMNGVATDPQADSKLFKAIEGTPYADEYKRMAAYIPQRQAVAMLPMSQQQAQIDALVALRNTKGTSTALEGEIKARRDVLAATTKAYDDSPLRASQTYGLQSLEPVDTTTLQTIVQTIGPRMQQAELARTVTGKPAAPLLPEEIDTLRSHLSTLAPPQFGDAVAQLGTKLPPAQLAALAKAMDDKDRPLGLAMAAGSDMTTEGRTVSELIRRGAQFAKDKSVKEDQGAELGLRAKLAAEVADSVPTAARADVLDAARLIYFAKQGEGNQISIKGAVSLAIGGQIIEHNGRRIPVPAGVDDLQSRLMAYPRAAIDEQAPDGFVYLPGGRPMGVPEFLAALPSAQLEPDGRGVYLVRSGGSLVMNNKRQPIVVRVR